MTAFVYDENRPLEISRQLEAYKNQNVAAAVRIRQAVDRMRLKYLKASPPKDTAS